jgi:hypothetical protein
MNDDDKKIFNLIEAGAKAENERLEAAEIDEALDKLLAPELQAILVRADEATRRRYLDHLRDYVAFARRSGVNADLPISGPLAASWIFHEWLADGRDIAKAHERVRAVRFLNETDAYCEAVIMLCKSFDPGGGGGIPVTVRSGANDNSVPAALVRHGEAFAARMKDGVSAC